MASYKIQIKPAAAKELEAIPLKDRKRLIVKIRRLAQEPRPAGCEKLSGAEKLRLRQGDYVLHRNRALPAVRSRILYSVDDANSSIVVVKLGHRRDVCR